MKQKRSGMNKISPVGLATTALVANQVSVLATYNEKLCRPYCVNGTTVFVPIVATISIISPVIGNRNVMRAQPLIYTERWVAAFQGQTALPTAVTIASVGRTQKANDVVCGKARGLSIFDSLTVALTTA